MKYQLKYNPQHLSASLELPASKSISNRALLLKALSNSPCTLYNLSDCDDTRVMMKALETKDTTIHIEGAGTAMRFLTAYYSNIPGHHLLTGNERMKQRPIADLVDTLSILGADISYQEKEGYPPLLIRGKQLKGGRTIEISLENSSQYASAIAMMACKLEGGLQIHPTNNIMVSRPYIEMTLQLMQKFGINAHWENERIVVPEQSPSLTSYTVENDWSAASYWYELLAIIDKASDNKPSIYLPHLYPDSLQGDARIATLFTKIGVQTHYSSEGILLETTAIRCNHLQEDVSDIPDLVPTIVVTCCMLGIPFELYGVQTLHLKECDRIQALICEMAKLGFVLENNMKEHGESLNWRGTKETLEYKSNVLLNTYDDHRMAMALSGVSINFPMALIDCPSVVSKSYPSYWEQLTKLGFSIEQIP